MSGSERDTRINRLRSVPLFADLSDDALQRILDCATEFDAPDGQVLAEAKMAGSGLFVIEEGSVSVDVPGHAYELGPGEFFGELSLLADHPRAARVRARKNLKGLALSRHDFERILDAEPKLTVAMLRTLAKRLIDQTPH